MCATREPGGTKVGEKVRSILLASRTGKLAPLAELALIYAARAQHLEEVVRPALARGNVVVSDRFNDASFAYQGYGRRLGVAIVQAFDRVICGRTRPTSRWSSTSNRVLPWLVPTAVKFAATRATAGLRHRGMLSISA